MVQGQIFTENDILVIVRNIWQKLSNIERKVTLIVTHFWQLLPRIFGETLLIVTNIWRNRTCFLLSVRSCKSQHSADVTPLRPTARTSGRLHTCLVRTWLW